MFVESRTSLLDGEIGEIIYFSCVKTPVAESEAAAGEAADHISRRGCTLEIDVNQTDRPKQSAVQLQHARSAA